MVETEPLIRILASDADSRGCRRKGIMKVMTTWSIRPGHFRSAVQRFLAGDAAPRPGNTLLGRWHSVDLSVGYSLYETDNPAAVFEGAARWTELLDIKTVIVVEDEVAGPLLMKAVGT